MACEGLTDRQKFLAYDTKLHISAVLLQHHGNKQKVKGIPRRITD